MPRVLLILALVATAFWVFTIVDCALQPSSRHRGVSKPVWVLIVVLLPVLGGLLWLLVGRTRKAATVRRRRAPDDDPEFLGKIAYRSDQDERIRRLEEELALLDSEDDDPRWTHPDGPAASATGSASPASPGTPATPPAPDVPRADGDDDIRGQRGALG